jgi:hypothetical protein
LLRGKQPPAEAYRELSEALQHWTPADGHAARNELRALALGSAPSLEALLPLTTFFPVGMDHGGLTLSPVPEGTQPRFYEASARPLNTGLTTAQLMRAAELDVLSPEARLQVATAAWVRATVLGNEPVLRTATERLLLLHSEARTALGRISGASNAAERNLELVALLVQFPWYSANVKALEPVLRSNEYSTQYADYFWCAPGPVDPPAFQSSADRATVERELHALGKLGTGIEFLAERALAAQRAFPRDPRLPEMLHKIVRATRYVRCGENKTKWSRAVFQALHRSYPNSKWARATPYYY